MQVDPWVFNIYDDFESYFDLVINCTTIIIIIILEIVHIKTVSPYSVLKIIQSAVHLNTWILFNPP